MRHIILPRSWAWFVSMTFALALIAACGGGSTARTGAGESTGQGGQPVVPTMPPARFTAVAQQSVTNTAPISLTAAPPPDTQVDAQTLERGGVIYVNRKCGDCHGARGEGIVDKGSALAGAGLTLQEFEHILRTGGNGELGPDHLYGSSAISPTGMRALHAWLQSLPPQ